MGKWLSLIAGGAGGTIARYWLSGIIYQIMGAGFPYGTFAVNILGCLLLGVLAALSEDRFSLGPEARLLLMVGFCGAFTTFSTFILETSHLIRDGQAMRAWIYLIGSVTVGFIFFRLGLLLGDLV